MKSIALVVSISFLLSPAAAQDPKPVPVTADNFIRAETDKTFAGIVKLGGIAKYQHYRQHAPIATHMAQRGNRDTL